MQLYKYGVRGFLHWGLNHWNSQNSVYRLDPFKVTDARLAFPSGDAFLVYTGKEGPIGSIRLKLICEAMQDIRALELLESLRGRDYVMESKKWAVIITRLIIQAGKMYFLPHRTSKIKYRSLYSECLEATPYISMIQE